MRDWTLSAVALAAAWTPAMSQPKAVDTVFGVQLNAALTLPSCPQKVGPHGTVFREDADYTCKSEPHQWQGFGLPFTPVMFPYALAPQIVKRRSIMVLEYEGKVVSVEFFTRGADSQEYVLGELVKKYGKPKYKTHDVISNGFGVTYDGIRAEWRLKGLEVNFTGVNGTMDEGLVVIDTPAAKALRVQWAKEETAKRTPL